MFCGEQQRFLCIPLNFKSGCVPQQIISVPPRRERPVLGTLRSHHLAFPRNAAAGYVLENARRRSQAAFIADDWRVYDFFLICSRNKYAFTAISVDTLRSFLVTDVGVEQRTLLWKIILVWIKRGKIRVIFIAPASTIEDARSRAQSRPDRR